MHIQILGLCRFSLLVTGGFAKGPRDLDERIAFLFNDYRLALRMAWFEHVLVPSLRQQDNDDFRFVALASTKMPRVWQGMLQDIVATCPAMEVEFAEPGEHWQVTNAALRKRHDPKADIIASFRLDDDDGLAANYITRVRRDFDDVLWPLFGTYGHVSCDYTRGLIIEADGTTARLQRSYVHAWPAGQTIYQKPGATLGLFTMGHHRHFRHMPVVALQDSDMFLRGRHSVNDSGLWTHAPDTKDVDFALMPQLFGVSLDDLQAALREAETLADESDQPDDV